MTKRSLAVGAVLVVFCVSLGVGIWLLASPANDNTTSPTQTGTEAADRWGVIYVGRQRVGYVHETTTPLPDEDQNLLRTTQETHLNFQRFGQPTVIQTHLKTLETTAGDLVSFSFETRNPPATVTRVSGLVEGAKLHLTTETAGKTESNTIPWNRETKSPSWFERNFEADPLAEQEIRTFRVYVPELNQVATVEIAADDMETERMLDGQRKRLLKATVERSTDPFPIDVWLTESGEALKTSLPIFGKELTTYRVSQEEALRKIAGEELDLSMDTMVSVKPIPNAHRTRKIVYRIFVPGADIKSTIPSEPYQTVDRSDESTAEVVVTAVDPQGTGKTSEVDSVYLQATRFLQTGDPNVQALSAQVPETITEPAEVAIRLEKIVHETLTNKNFSTALASAAEVAASREGDCTEHAVLLAALLRVKKIPSRIAVGLVYVDSLNGFGGHMWTEAFLGGQWVPLDATLGQGGIGAAHIKLAESSFADDAPAPVTTFLPLMNILGQIEIEVLEVE
ncbi:transglutaminase-like domain-containing protein [Thalassoroseus pseudoceratinae]|uniref:transglutaminase-like domain-containing protein n=1 Tax=Thalassoroseus pseudoceratinae TaxID=2713176 RepID=UPI00141F7F46|nr:transglutaminase family protein [Thalassoroseus pseudoceratinae]